MSEEKISKDDFIRMNSHGFDLSRDLYGLGGQGSQSTGNSIPVNLRLRKEDIELFDAIAKKFNVSRSALIGDLVERDVIEMFDKLEIVDADILAKAVDARLESDGVYHNNSNAYGYGYWRTRTLMPHPQLDNPDNPSLLRKK
ncbi:hypothetical protein [Shewanella sp.]|uniref:hypothetical protein n=1 Tax=Shewanella sp. TaxID=50422 RepID=UPI003F3DC55F